MTHVVTDNCIGCKFTDCASACPVDNCFIEGPNFLAIDPNECIDCGVCIPECPADAILFEFDEHPEMDFWKEKNAELAAKWGPERGINDIKDPLPDADARNGEEGKLKDLIEDWD